jgi:hypothetical protein
MAGLFGSGLSGSGLFGKLGSLGGLGGSLPVGNGKLLEVVTQVLDKVPLRGGESPAEKLAGVTDTVNAVVGSLQADAGMPTQAVTQALDALPINAPDLPVSPDQVLANVTGRLGSLDDVLPLEDGEVDDFVNALVDRATLEDAAILGDGLSPDGTSPGFFNGATTNEVAQSEPIALEIGTGRLGLAVLSGADAGGDDSTISVDLLSFANDSDDSAPPLALGFGPDDSTNLDIEVLSGSYGSDGTGNINIGPDIWSGGSPFAIHALNDLDDPFANDVHVGGNIFDPVTDGTSTNAVVATGLFDDVFAV